MPVRPGTPAPRLRVAAVLLALPALIAAVLAAPAVADGAPDLTAASTSYAVSRAAQPASPGPAAHRAARRTSPTPASVSAGGQFSCGIRAGGSLYCWGFDSYGQLGNHQSGAGSATPTRVGRPTGWAQVSSGGATACAIRYSHALFCWGLDHRGQLGDRDDHSVFAPQVVRGPSDWAQVSTGWWHTCAVKTDHTLWCWGDDSSGQLGVGSTKSDLRRHQVAGHTWSSVAVAGADTCAIKTDATLWCWGRNLFGQLGNGTLRDASRPTQVGSAHNWAHVALSWTHACAVTRAGAARCWGRNDQHQASSSTASMLTRPTAVPGDHVARSIAVSEGSSCLVDTGGALWCWGDNRYGQVRSDLPATPGVATPARRTGNYAAVSGGWFHLCALTASGASSCWGADDKGQLGASGASPAPTSPAPKVPAPQSAAAEPPARAARAGSRTTGAPLTLRLATFNTLGNHHTLPGRDADDFAPSRLRGDWEAQSMLNNHIQVAGLEEQDAGQLSTILNASHGALSSFPTPDAGDLGVETAVVWDNRSYSLVRSGLVRMPFIARDLRRPYVELRQLSTGRTFWVFAVHNAPNTYQSKREAETKIETDKINELSKSGLPVFFVGDMNEKESLYCRVVRHTDLGSASGGRVRGERCVPPAHERIDWIFGPRATTRWSGFDYTRPPLARLSTDHHVPVVDVTVR